MALHSSVSRSRIRQRLLPMLPGVSASGYLEVCRASGAFNLQELKLCFQKNHFLFNFRCAPVDRRSVIVLRIILGVPIRDSEPILPANFCHLTSNQGDGQSQTCKRKRALFSACSGTDFYSGIVGSSEMCRQAKMPVLIYSTCSLSIICGLSSRNLIPDKR